MALWYIQRRPMWLQNRTKRIPIMGGDKVALTFAKSARVWEFTTEGSITI